MDDTIVTTRAEQRSSGARVVGGGLTFWAAAVMAATLGFSRLAYGLLLPAMQHDLGGSYSAYGLVASANFIGYLAATLLLPVLLGFSHKHVQLNTSALLLMNAAVIASATSADLQQLAAWRLLVGVFSAIATVLTISLTLEHAVPARRGSASGLLWLGGAGGLVLAGLAAPLVLRAGGSLAWRGAWIVMGAYGIVVALAFHRAAAQADQSAATPPPDQRTAAQTLQMLARTLVDTVRPRGLLLLACANWAFGGGYIVYFTFVIALATRQGIPALWAGAVWALLGLAGMAGSLAWGRLADRWPGGVVLAGALALCAAGTASVLSGNRGVEVIGAFVVGATTFGAPTVVTASLKRAVPGARYAVSLSLITAMLALGQAVGPVIAGRISDAAGLATGTASAAVFLAVAALCAAGYGAVQHAAPRHTPPFHRGRVVHPFRGNESDGAA